MDCTAGADDAGTVSAKLDISRLQVMEEFINRLAKGEIFSSMSDRQWKRDVIMMANNLLNIS